MRITTRGIFLTTIFFYFALCLAPNKLIAFVVIALYAGGLMFALQSIPDALCTAYAALLPINLGKQFPITLISATQLNIFGRSLGIAADIIVTGREAIVGIMALMIMWKFLKQKQFPWPHDRLGWALFFLPIILMFSAFFGSLLPWISFFHTLFFIEPFILYTYAMTYHVTDHRSLVAALVAAVGFEGIIALIQNIKGGTIGLLIEDYPGYIPLDTSRDISNVTFRLGGTFAHANILAHHLIFVLMAILPTVFDALSSLRFVGGLASIIGVLALIATESRSAWLAWIIGVVVFLYLAEKVWHIRLKLPRIAWLAMLVSMPILLVLAILVVLPRVAGTVYTFEPFGSAQTRQLLFGAAFAAIVSHPLFGVGIAMDVYYMFLNMAFGPRGSSVVSYFPEPVHNGFIQLFVQTGVIGFIAYVTCWIVLLTALWQLMKKAKHWDRVYLGGLFAGIIAAMVNAQLQPMAPNLSVAVLLYMTWRKVDLR